MPENIQVLKLRYGVYRLYSIPGNEGMTVTAQDLRDIADWCLLHMSELEQEAGQVEVNTRIEEDR